MELADLLWGSQNLSKTKTIKNYLLYNDKLFSIAESQ